jgi:hypothetical protein
MPLNGLATSECCGEADRAFLPKPAQVGYSFGAYYADYLLAGHKHFGLLLSAVRAHAGARQTLLLVLFSTGFEPTSGVAILYLGYLDPSLEF